MAVTALDVAGEFPGGSLLERAEVTTGAGRYVVSRPLPTSNVGSNLASLAGALWLARQIDGALVVDWRGLTQLRDKELNYFTEFFEHPGHLMGVPVVYAWPGEPPGWGAEHEVAVSDARALARDARPDKRVLVLCPYHGLDRVDGGDLQERRRFLEAFYREIVPGREVRERIDAWYQSHLAGAFAVGVNIRTGNGHYFGKGMPYHGRVDLSVFENRRRFLRVLQRACRARLDGLPRSLRDGARIFFATDADEMSRLLAALPRAVTRRTVFPPAGAGDNYAFASEHHDDRAGVTDTLVDMFLLARCNALVYNPSTFHQYARVVTNDFDGNLRNVESLFVRYWVRRARLGLRRRIVRG